jgi:hypothetical protein
MSRKWILRIVVVIGVFIFFHLARGHSNPVDRPGPSAIPQAARPFPAEVRTTKRQQPALHQSKGAHTSEPRMTQNPYKTSAAAKGAGNTGQKDGTAEASNLTPDLGATLKQIVKLYASWPGTTTKKRLIRGLQMEQPYITAEAIKHFKEEWIRTPTTVKLTVKRVDLEPSFFASATNPNSADITAFVQLKKQFKPVTGHPYTQLATQLYVINLRIIKRRWTVVGIALPSLSASTGG